MDLAQQLERAIPAGPQLPPPETRAATGRKALRRRRAAVAVGAVAAIAVPSAVAAGGTTTRGHDPAPPVSRPTASEPSRPADRQPSRRERDPSASYPWVKGEVVTASPSDGLLLRPGTAVLHRQGPLYPGKATESVAVRVRFEGLEYWAACEWDDGGSTCQAGSPRDPFYSGWADFVAKATSGGGMTNGPVGSPGKGGGAAGDDAVVPADLPWLSADLAAGEIRADGPGRLLDQQTDVRMPASVAPPGTPTAAALVADADTRYLAMFRGDERLVVVEATGHGDSLDELLVWARGRYRSGSGLL